MSKRQTSDNIFRSVLQATGQAKSVPARGRVNTSPAALERSRVKQGYTQVGAYIPSDLKKEVFQRLQERESEQESNFSALVTHLLAGWVATK